MAAPESPATRLAGITSAGEITPAVIVTAGTVVRVSIGLLELSVVVIVNVPVAPDTAGFLTTPNTTVVTPAVKMPGVPPVPRVTVHT